MARKAATSSTTAAAPNGRLEHVDPGELIIGSNVRVDRDVDPAFVASIRERGVLEPIVAYVRDDDNLVVVHGQRRTIAAVDAGRATVPVMVVDRPEQVDQVVDQLAENEHRASLTVADRASAYHQLQLLGLSAAAIAKRTASPREQVDAALTAIRSTSATAAMLRLPQITLDQAATLAEFEDDPEATKRLLHTVEAGHGFDHTAQRFRDDRARDREEYDAGADLRAAGVHVVQYRDLGSDVFKLELNGLLHDGETLTVESHAACPGHAAYMADDRVLDDDGAAKDVWTPEYICISPAAYGHVSVYDARQAEADKAKAKMEAQRRAEADIDKEWHSARKVRRDWLRQLLARKTPPKGTAAWVAQSLANNDQAIRGAFQTGHVLAHELLGINGYKPDWWAGTLNQHMVGLLDGAGDGRANTVVLALALAGYEASLTPEHWRHLNHTVKRYLRFLQEIGYELSEVELRACGVKPKAKRSTGRKARVAEPASPQDPDGAVDTTG